MQNFNFFVKIVLYAIKSMYLLCWHYICLMLLQSYFAQNYAGIIASVYYVYCFVLYVVATSYIVLLSNIYYMVDIYSYLVYLFACNLLFSLLQLWKRGFSQL